MTFSDLGLNAALLQSLSENNISSPSEIQQKAIPVILNSTKNVVGVAQTGTGKTAAFGLPVLQQINPSLQQTQVLVLVPTRELGQQVAKDLFVFSRYIVRIHTEAVYGGKKIEEQIKKLETPKHILVATPGRLLDLIARKAVNLSNLKYLILDEADEMLNMGFLPDIDKIMKIAKPTARKLLFTSTLGSELKLIIREYLGTDIEEIRIKPQEYVNRNIEHQYLAYQYGYKLEYLKAFLLKHSNERGIIFCRTQAAAKLLGQQLAGFDIVVGSLYGDLNQYERTKVMHAFKDKRIEVLIATDIAARGIDVSDLNYVIHYHLPDNEAQYVNRSGRTARAGKKGKSIALLQSDELYHKDDFEDALRIRFEPIKLDITIDKKESCPVKMTINVGTRHEQTPESLKQFLMLQSGVKEEAIQNVLVYRAHATFDIDSKYQSQLINNIHQTKHFHQRVLIEETAK
ncbi:DEAD/DEAH box helicase [Cytophaga hutchinsonii]|uniref:Inducible ATP-independent RNA helicase n=1 Tax=Cytophaga hutchinsonii (strain ATCC 33406 / DSM 1761 / CIP 103989 / NBRC 15051 / NCIMB 9469 / D465) TaxID=269798 RepID=A0A6N4SVA8_CYTH3|nr:DEAD/DEAH box helicase [Cytophaga hutchinsonii]ABG60355.1 inducible ATP-independent RNA helicase [Cytophaga hutchinsonii ATCC 33406]SFX87611.1 ATP-dependent RNA helicase DeaD [Cytophaga hutchinsonii ATCC 33406]